MTERPVGEGLERVLRSLGGTSVDGLRIITEQWADIVGEPTAERTWPLVIEEKRLVVAASDSAAAEDLRWREAEVVARIGDLTGEAPDRVEVRVRPGGGAERSSQPPDCGQDQAVGSPRNRGSGR